MLGNFFTVRKRYSRFAKLFVEKAMPTRSSPLVTSMSYDCVTHGEIKPMEALPKVS